VVLAILILAILTAAALAALHWFQRRASVAPENGHSSVALSQTRSPMYNDLTSTTHDLRLRETDHEVLF